MSRRMRLDVIVVLGLAVALLPIAAAAQEIAAQVGAAPQWDKPGNTLPDGKEPPNEAPGLPLDLPPGAEAVATGYGWSQTTGSYTEITGGTVHGNASNDDASFTAVGLGFTFTYDGAAYTQVSIQSNGFLAMGVTVSSSYTPLSTGTTNNVIAALGRDLQGNGTTSELMSLMEGTAPNRVFTVQWKHYKRYGTSYSGDDFNFQIKLHETSNVVEIVYGPFTVVSVTTPPTVQVGLRGAANTDFNNRTSTGDWTTSAAGATNTASMALTNVYFPPSGLTWTWTPAAPSPFFGTSSKTAPAQALMGDSVDYTVSIVNSGTAAAAAATMVDPIPAGTTYNADVSCSAGTCGFDGSNVTWSGTVAIGETVTVSFSVDTDGAPCAALLNQATLDDPGLVGGSLDVSASTQLVSTIPSPLDGFEVSVPPPGWTEAIVNDPGTDPDWSQVAVGTYPTIAPHGGGYMAKFNSFNTGSGGSARLWTNALDLSGYAAPAVAFWMSHDTGYSGNADRIQVQVSLDGTTWVDAGEPVLRYDAAYATPGWGEHVVVLPTGFNVNGVYIGFLGISAYGNNFYLDDTAVAEGWYPCAFTSLAPDGAAATCPGGSVTYPLTLTNMNPDPDTFDVTVAGNAWTTTPSPAQLVLAPGASGSVTVAVDAPWTPGSDTAVVTALGQTYGGTDAATLVTTAASTYWQSIATEPDSGRMDNVSAAWDGKVWSITGYGANLDVRSYDPLTDAWTVVGTPPTAFAGNYVRSGCQAGSKVYMYGDASTAGFTGLWSYDMATGAWTQETPGGTPPAPTGIWAPAWAHDAETGICYLTGGATAAGAGNLTTVHVYDPAANAWLAQLPDFASVRDFHAAWVFRDATDRKLLCVAGGNNGAGMTSTQCYDLTAGTWGAENADIGPLPADLWGMGYAQKQHEGAIQLWVTGGVRADALTATTSFFDVVAGAWADDGDLASGAVYRTSATTLDNEIFNVGGSIGSFSFTGLASHHVQCVPPGDIDVSPASMTASQLANTTTQQTLTIANVGAGDLSWTITEDDGATAELLNWSDDFDSYATGSQLHGQGGWKGWGNDPAAGALTSSAQARSAPNSADIFGGSDLVHEVTATDGQWVFTAWQYIPSAFTGESFFILLNQYDDAGVANNWSTQVRFTAATNLVTNDGPAGGTLPLLRDAWVEIRVEIDLVADTQTFYYGNQLLFSGSWSDGQSGGGITSIAAVDLFANGATSVYYDDISLTEQLAVCTAPTDIPWLSTNLTAGTIPPSGNQLVDVTFDSTGLALGTFQATICVLSDDPDEPVVPVPVTMEVVIPVELQSFSIE